MYVLFSPIGNSDPWRGQRDGAMLHIVRHYKPKKVVLYFTKSIFEGDKPTNGHKLFDWEYIIQQVSPSTFVELIIDDVENPSDYDVYKEVFHEAITKLHTDYKKETVLLNVTSGTPQMSATLCLEYITYSESKLAVQVVNPEKKSNAEKEYDPPLLVSESLKIVNELEQNEKPRYSEIKILSFREAMWKTMTQELLSCYDYVGAREIFKQLKKDMAVKLLSEKIEEINNQRIFSDIDKRYDSYNLKKILCQFLILQMRFDQKHYSDVLIRIKSITEFLCQEYLIQQRIVRRNFDKYIEVDNYEYVKSVHKDVNGRILKNLHSYIDILEYNNINPTLLNYSKEVLLINDDRNKVAHNLEPLELTFPMLEKAFNASKQLLKAVFPLIKEKDYYYFKNFNETLGKYL